MSALAAAAADYLGVRRALGYKLEGTEANLASFVAYMDAGGAEHVTVAAALDWANQAPRGGVAQRLANARGFIRYLQALDAAHEVPPAGLVPLRSRRAIPHLFTEADIAALMHAAAALSPPPLASTVATVIGLLGVTGMRVGEVLRLNVVDVDLDAGVLTVWLGKFNKSRHVPLDPTTVTALAGYSRQRRAATKDTTAFFVSGLDQRLTYVAFAKAFADLLDSVGIGSAQRRPRIMDLRHSFATRTLLGWYSEGADVQALLPRLSTYLGHVDPTSTYWYLSAAPELMAIAAERLEQHAERRS